LVVLMIEIGGSESGGLAGGIARLLGEADAAADAEHDHEEAGQCDEFAGEGACGADLLRREGGGQQSIHRHAGGGEGQAGEPVTG
jgi:hypothetical protein